MSKVLFDKISSATIPRREGRKGIAEAEDDPLPVIQPVRSQYQKRRFPTIGREPQGKPPYEMAVSSQME